MSNESGLHIWHVDPKTKVRKYVGPAKSDLDWLEFKRTQGDKRDQFVCNNISPTGTVVVRQAPSQPSSKAAQAMADARRTAMVRDAENRKKVRIKREKDEKRRAEDAEMMKGVRADADGLLKKHKRDEKADLEAGINR